MTVISTIISRYCTAHATDSLVTQEQNDGSYKILDQETTKILCVRRWAGIMAYCGLSTKPEYGWSTLDWLSTRVSQAKQFTAPEDFANDLKDCLSQELAKMTFRKPIEQGIGIHFTAYERVDGYLIPELFAISNFKDTSYQELHPDGIRVTRETYGVAFQTDDRGPQYAQSRYRRDVHKFLQSNNVLIYNNGDPWMFNSAAGAIGNLFEIARQRKVLRAPSDAKAHRDIVVWPIQLVSKVQRHFVIEGHQKVGGKLHNLSVTQNGEYETDTGEVC